MRLIRKKKTHHGEANSDTPLQDTAAILWDESRRQIVRQEADLDTLRNRAIALLSVSSLVAGLFGGRIVTTHRHPTWVTAGIVVALAAFGVGVLVVLAVLAPRWKWEFAQDLSTYFEDLADSDIAPVDVTGKLAKDFEASWDRNAKKLKRLYVWFTIACVLTGVQVIAWGISIL